MSGDIIMSFSPKRGGGYERASNKRKKDRPVTKPPIAVNVGTGKILFWNVDVNGNWIGDPLE